MYDPSKTLPNINIIISNEFISILLFDYLSARGVLSRV